MPASTLLAFTIAYTLMALAPGPVVILVVSYALSRGRRVALAVVAGTVLGDATCLVGAALGLGALLAASAAAFTVLKFAGAAYLVFLGVMLWRAKVAPASKDAPPVARSLWRVFGHAYLATVLNPKSVLFFMLFLPQFLDDRAALAPQLAAMLTAIVVCGTLVDGSYSVFAASLRRFVRGSRAQRTVNRVAGGILVGEGIAAATWRGLVAIE